MVQTLIKVFHKLSSLTSSSPPSESGKQYYFCNFVNEEIETLTHAVNQIHRAKTFQDQLWLIIKLMIINTTQESSNNTFQLMSILKFILSPKSNDLELSIRSRKFLVWVFFFRVVTSQIYLGSLEIS